MDGRSESSRREAGHIARDLAEVPKPLRAKFNQLWRAELAWPLYLWGKPGRGKTCASLVFIDHFGGWYYTLTELVKTVQDATFGRLLNLDGAKIGVTEWWKSWALVPRCCVIDDIGRHVPEKRRDEEYGVLYAALENRISRPLILVGNHDIESIANIYDDAIASRANAGTILELGGPDRRLR